MYIIIYIYIYIYIYTYIQGDCATIGTYVLRSGSIYPIYFLGKNGVISRSIFRQKVRLSCTHHSI